MNKQIEETLRTEIEAFLHTSMGIEPWDESWQAARLIFLLHPYLGDEEDTKRELHAALHKRLDAHRGALERMGPTQWNQSVQESHAQLQHVFEQIVGDPNQSQEVALQELQALQKELDALQWLTSAVREEEDFAIAEAFADLSMLEREVGRLKREEKQQKQPAVPALKELDDRLHKLRGELLEREGNHFLHATVAIVPSITASLKDAVAPPSVNRTRSRRLGSRPRRLTSQEAANRPPVFQEIIDDLGADVTIDPQARPANQASEGSDSSTPRTDPSMPAGLGTNDRLKACWDALLQGESLVLATALEAMSSPANAMINKHLEALKRRHQQLKEQLQEGLAPLSNEARRSWCVANLSLMSDEIDEQLATLDDLEMTEAVIHLRQMETQMAWMLSMVEPLHESGKATHKPFAATAKQIKRLHRRLRAEAQEKKLQGRLEAKFGPAAVAFSDNLILALIFLVVAFLTIEYIFKLSPNAKLAMMWADTAICAIFLTEFFVKLSFAEGKGLYFRRHFLIDLLPSIPFSLIFWIFHGPAVAHIAAARVARISRVARYVRVFRPLVRIFRVLTFVMRALDRLVRKYETVFNRNVMLFPSPSERKRAMEATPEANIQQMRERCRKRTRMMLMKMEPAERVAFLVRLTSTVENQLSGHDGASRQQGLLRQSAEIVYFEQLIDGMMRMDEIEAEEILGEGFIQQTTRIFRFLALPGVRILPIIRRGAKAYQELSPPALVAWVIQGIGRGLERIQRVFQWVGDLYGIVTGPQVLDRIGVTLINATLRPAKRLLIFGLLFLVVTLFIQAFSLGWLHDAAKFLTKFLGAPIIILGLVSLIPLTLGFWFRMIAGETTDFFARISEAQFIARLKQIKHHKSSFDLRHIVLRVLHPESLLRGKLMQPPEQLVEQLQGQLGQHGEFTLNELSPHSSLVDLPQPHALEEGIVHEGEEGATLQTDWSERDRILLLYEDYLDGTPLHRSDTKTTNHLLGNITIQNIRKHRLGLNLVQNLRIEKLDLSRPRLLLYFGPYLWFASITESLTHRIARLIVEYNQNCIPSDELVWQDQDERDIYEHWLDRREKQLAGVPLPPERQKKDEQEFRTTAFTALHFLSAEPERDSAVGRQFGERLVKLMQAERRLLMREIFGYFPFHRMPKDKRTFNLFQSYQRHIARGRFFLLPLKLVWWIGSALVWGVVRIHTLVRDVLQPPSQVETEVAGLANFDVAIRKINRMRKPIYTECMRLRAAFDLEYLGIYLPGRTQSGLEGSNYQADLEFIDASARERIEFEALYESRAEQLVLLNECLEENGWGGEMLHETLADIHPDLAAKEGEVLRAMTAAFASDYKKLRSLLQADHELRQFFGAEATPIEVSLWMRCKQTCQAATKTLFFLRPNKERDRFATCYAAAPRLRPLEVEWQRYLQESETLRKHFKLVATTEENPRELASTILGDVIQHSSIWTEEILTLRTLQTLTQLDIQLYRELVHTIGEYER